MIEERAVILSLETSSSHPQSSATIEIVRKTACGLCGQTRGCGNSIWGKLLGHKTTHFSAQNEINAQVGDYVIVGIEESVLIKGAFLLYILPLATMLVGAWLAKLSASSDGATMVGALLGLAVGFLWVKGHAQGSAYAQQNQPRILRLDKSGVLEKPIEFHS